LEGKRYWYACPIVALRLLALSGFSQQHGKGDRMLYWCIPLQESTDENDSFAVYFS